MNLLLKTVSTISITLVLSACANSGTAILNSLAKTGDYKRTSNITYAANSKNKLDVYQAVNPTLSKNSVIVFFYGGCWGECSNLKKEDYLFVAQSFASRGITTVIANFRQYPEVNFQTLIADASNVINWTVLNINQYGGNPKRIFIAGHSSGAHIASMLALNPRSLLGVTKKGIRGFIGLAGPYDFLPLDEDYQKQLFNASNNYANSQPINFLSKGSPPLLILHGEKDTTVAKQNAISLDNRARSLGVDQTLKLYPEHTHTSILTALSRPLQRNSTVLEDIVSFVKNK